MPLTASFQGLSLAPVSGHEKPFPVQQQSAPGSFPVAGLAVDEGGSSSIGGMGVAPARHGTNFPPPPPAAAAVLAPTEIRPISVGSSNGSSNAIAAGVASGGISVGGIESSTGGSTSSFPALSHYLNSSDAGAATLLGALSSYPRINSDPQQTLVITAPPPMIGHMPPAANLLSATIKVRGIPYRSKPQDILDFFQGYQVKN